MEYFCQTADFLHDLVILPETALFIQTVVQLLQRLFKPAYKTIASCLTRCPVPLLRYRDFRNGRGKGGRTGTGAWPAVVPRPAGASWGPAAV